MAAGFDCISPNMIGLLTVYDTVYLTSIPPVYQQYTNSISQYITVYHSQSHGISQ